MPREGSAPELPKNDTTRSSRDEEATGTGADRPSPYCEQRGETGHEGAEEQSTESKSSSTEMSGSVAQPSQPVGAMATFADFLMSQTGTMAKASGSIHDVGTGGATGSGRS